MLCAIVRGLSTGHKLALYRSSALVTMSKWRIRLNNVSDLGSTANLVMGRVISPVDVLSFTARTSPYGPG